MYLLKIHNHFYYFPYEAHFRPQNSSNERLKVYVEELKVLDRYVNNENTILKAKCAQLREKIKILTSKNKMFLKFSRMLYKQTQYFALHNKTLDKKIMVE